MDASDPNATTPPTFQGGTANWRTDLYATGGTLLSHKESIQLIKSLGAKYTPELKGPNRSAQLQVEDVFGSQEGYAQALIDDYKEAGIPAQEVFAQSFNRNDVLYWINTSRSSANRLCTSTIATKPSRRRSIRRTRTWIPSMQELAKQGIKIIAPPMWVLLTVENGKIVPSLYAKEAKAAGLDIITWTSERSGRIVEDVLPTKGTSNPSFYYQSTLDALDNDGDILVTLDALARSASSGFSPTGRRQ